MKKFMILSFSIILLFAFNLPAQNLLHQADSLYEMRGEVFDEAKLIADSTNINKEEAIWKLIRAYYFKGKYTTDDPELKKKIYDLGKELGEVGLEEFPESAGINLFSP